MAGALALGFTGLSSLGFTRFFTSTESLKEFLTLGIEDGVLLKWKAVFGSTLASCVILGASSILNLAKDKRDGNCDSEKSWLLQGPNAWRNRNLGALKLIEWTSMFQLALLFSKPMCLGEEYKGDKLNRFVIQLSALADVYVNDAFGSWQPHGSTYHIAKYLPSYAGLCMQGELYHVQSVLNPSKPFVAIFAGAKYDTKIGPLKEIYKKIDKLVLGGLIYNTYLCAKYGVKISGVEESDIELAKELVVQDKVHKKILELQVLVEIDTLEGRFEGKFRTIDVKDFAPGQTYKYVVDVDPVSFERDEVKQEMNLAKTIFVNVVMGLMPNFWHGTSKMDEVIDKNRSAQKFFGGGDTLQTFKSLHPALYEAALNNVKYYLFTGGGTVLKVIEEGDPMGLETIKALIDNKANYSKRSQNN